MKFGKKILIAGLCLAMGVTTVGFVFAQQNNAGGRGQARGNFDPAQMEQRRIDRATTDLNLSAAEAKVIVPKIEKIVKLQTAAFQDIRPLSDDLDTLVKDSKSSDKAIKVALDKLKAKIQDTKKQLDAAEAELKGILTVKQEAELTLSGLLNGGVGFGGGRGFGGGGRGGNNGGTRGGNRGANNGGN